MDEMKKPRQLGRGPGTVHLSPSQSYTSQSSMLDQQGQAAEGKEGCGNKNAKEEHITVYEPERGFSQTVA